MTRVRKRRTSYPGCKLGGVECGRHSSSGLFQLLGRISSDVQPSPAVSRSGSLNAKRKPDTHAQRCDSPLFVVDLWTSAAPDDVTLKIISVSPLAQLLHGVGNISVEPGLPDFTIAKKLFENAVTISEVELW